MNLQTIEMLSPIGSIESYVQAVRQIPMLTAEEEQQLARRFLQNQDLAAARQLVMAHLRFVVQIAQGYQGYGLQHADLIQEGNIGLMKAVKRFDPDVGVRLVTFAVHWIRAEIHEFILRNWRIVKVATTKAQRKLFFNLRSAKKRLGWMNQAEVEQVANDLGVQPKDVLEMEQRLNAHDAAFDGFTDEDDDGGISALSAPVNYLEDNRYDPARLIEGSDSAEQGQQQLIAAFEHLDERSRDILEKRWLIEPKATLHDLAAKYQVSAERIRQLEQNAMKKLKEAMLREVS